MVGLMDADAKKKKGLITVIGCIIFITHWVDVQLLIIPSSMKEQGKIGLIEFGFFFIFLGTFLFVILRWLIIKLRMMESFSIIGFSLAIAAPVIINYLKQQIPKENIVVEAEITKLDAPPPMDESTPPPPPPPPPPPVKSTIKFTPPEIKKDEDVT